MKNRTLDRVAVVFVTSIVSPMIACTLQTTEPTGEAADDETMSPGAAGAMPGTNNGGSGPGPAASGGTGPNPSAGATVEEALSVVDFPASVTVASPVSGAVTVGPGPQPGGPPPPGGAVPPPPQGAPSPQNLSGRVLLAAAPPAEATEASAYAESITSVASILSGEATIASEFDLNAFFVRSGNANCYGPNMSWESHPDALGGDAAAGQLPGGDLGIWTASTEAGEACAAAQLNARMSDVQAQVNMGLTGLAGLVAAYQGTGATWPDDVSPSDTLDLTTEMQAAGITGVTFDSATMSMEAIA